MKDKTAIKPVTDEGLSLKDLHKRLGQIIEQNEDRGWGSRNDLPLLVCLSSRTPSGRLRGSRYFPITYAQSSMLGFGGLDGKAMAVTCFERTEVNKKQKAKRTTVKQINTAMGLYPELRGYEVRNDAASKSIEIIFEDAYFSSIYYAADEGLSSRTAEEWVENVRNRIKS